MGPKKISGMIGLILVGAWLLALPVQVQAANYYFRDLGVMDGITSQAWGINDSRQVVGWVNYPAGSTYNSQAFLWNLATGMQPLGTLGGDHSFAYRITNLGVAAGESGTAPLPGFPSGIYTGFYKPLGLAMQQMKDLAPSSPYSRVYGINDTGQMVGFSNNDNAAYQPVFWQNPTAVPVALGTLGGDHGMALGLNASGVVAGWAEVTAGDTVNTRAFYWPGAGPIQDLGTLRTDGTGVATARSINDLNYIVGYATNENNLREAFLGLAGGSMIGLGGLGGNVSGLLSYSQDVNEKNEVVGYAYTPAGQQRAFLYTTADGIQDLNNLANLPAGVVLKRALGINEFGEIVGYTANNRAFLLSPDPSIVPLPGTVLLLGPALLGLGGWRSRKK